MLNKYKKDIFHTIILFFSFTGVFALGFFFSNIAQQEKHPIQVENISSDNYSTEKTGKTQEEEYKDNTIKEGAEAEHGEVVASVNSDVYHYLHCPSVGLINEENKIYFTSTEEAESAGFTLAGNCNP